MSKYIKSQLEHGRTKVQRKIDSSKLKANYLQIIFESNSQTPVMMARIPFGIPAWEIWVSLAILIASFLAMVWVAAKIYRVGIFMYGKKPSVKELIRWINYK